MATGPERPDGADVFNGGGTGIDQGYLFYEGSFDALLCDASLPDGGVYKVIEEFRYEFPGAPVAVVSTGDDICLQIWTRARRIRVFKKPLQLSDVQTWVGNLPHKPEPLPVS